MTFARAGVLWVLGATVGAVGAGCSDPDPAEPAAPDECALAGELLHAGALFDVVGFGEVAVCEGSLAEAEAHTLWVAEVWGEEPKTFEYRLFDSREHPCWPCPSGALACVRSGHLASPEIPHQHEITHAARPGICNALIEEGTAELYGNPFSQAATTGDLREMADGGRSEPGFYPFAARFVAFLTETWGLDPVKALCTHPIVDAASLDTALQTELGLSIDEVSAMLDAYPKWALGELRQDRACESGEAPVVSPGPWTFDLRCGAAGATGQPGGAMMAAQRIELPEFGAYSFDLVPAPGSTPDYSLRYELRNCARDGMASVYFTNGFVHSLADGSGNISLYGLPAGTYVLRVLLFETPEPVTLSASVERWF
jgi:hypothetical protein